MQILLLLSTMHLAYPPGQSQDRSSMLIGSHLTTSLSGVRFIHNQSELTGHCSVPFLGRLEAARTNLGIETSSIPETDFHNCWCTTFCSSLHFISWYLVGFPSPGREDARAPVGRETMIPFFNSALGPIVGSKEDDWSGISNRQKRKRLQNRLNQRAYSKLELHPNSDRDSS